MIYPMTYLPIFWTYIPDQWTCADCDQAISNDEVWYDRLTSSEDIIAYIQTNETRFESKGYL